MPYRSTHLRAPWRLRALTSLLVLWGSILSDLGDLGGLGSFAHATALEPRWQDQGSEFRTLRLRVDAHVLRTDQNYTDQGTPETPANFDGVSRATGRIGGAYGLTDRWTLFGGLSLTETQLTTPFLRARSRAGLGDQTLGVSAEIARSSWALVHLQSQLEFPLYSITDTEPELGDASADWTTGAFLRTDLGHWGRHRIEGSLGAGIKLRSSGYSRAVPVRFEFDLRPERGQSGWFLGGGIHGELSLKTDSRASDPRPEPSGSGGSAITGAWNPTLFNGFARLGYHFSDTHSVGAEAARTLAGANAPVGSRLSVAWTITLGPQPEVRPGSSRADDAEIAARRSAILTPGACAVVTAIHERQHLVKLRSLEGQPRLNTGQEFELRESETQKLRARGRIEDVRGDEAVLRIEEYYVDQPLETGLAAVKVTSPQVQN